LGKIFLAPKTNNDPPSQGEEYSNPEKNNVGNGRNLLKKEGNPWKKPLTPSGEEGPYLPKECPKVKLPKVSLPINCVKREPSSKGRKKGLTQKRKGPLGTQNLAQRVPKKRVSFKRNSIKNGSPLNQSGAQALFWALLNWGTLKDPKGTRESSWEPRNF